jgi:nucleoside 2-deoxyribosyltransferase
MTIYLAGAYSSDDPDVRQRRYVEHCCAAAKLAAVDQLAVFSPIAHGHSLCVDGGLDRYDHEFWMRQCMPFLRNADIVVVLNSDGLSESKGTAAEVAMANMIGIPVMMWDGDDVGPLAEMFADTGLFAHLRPVSAENLGAWMAGAW